MLTEHEMDVILLDLRIRAAVEKGIEVFCPECDTFMESFPCGYCEENRLNNLEENEK